jgi:hypothetical protein
MWSTPPPRGDVWEQFGDLPWEISGLIFMKCGNKVLNRELKNICS